MSATSPECKGHPKDLSTKLYGTVESCCERMGWIEKDTCKARSESGSSAEAESPGTGEWRKNPDWKKCVLGEFVVRLGSSGSVYVRMMLMRSFH